MRTSIVAVLLFLNGSFADANSNALVTLEVPAIKDIAAFTNGPLPSTGERDYKTKDEIMRFLSEGSYSRKTPSGDDHLKMNEMNKITDGIFTTHDGNFFFWRLISKDTLWLQTPEGGSAVLEITK